MDRRDLAVRATFIQLSGYLAKTDTVICSVNKPASQLWTYGTNDTCRPTTNPADSCTLGYFPIYVIMATTKQHIKAGIDFARKHNIRVIVRNTGHDFLNRSTGWGSLVINTHSFQDVSWISSYTGPGGYRGTAVKLGAGVQGRSILTQGHARNPPLAIVTGECPVSFVPNPVGSDHTGL